MSNKHTDGLNLLRSILGSYNDVQVRSSGDFDQVCLKLDRNIYINFLYDSFHPTSKLLTVNNINDLRISRVTYKDTFTHQQWIKIRDYFDQLIQQTNNDTPLHSIIQSMKSYLSIMSDSNENSMNSTQLLTTNQFHEDASTKLEKFHSADLIFNRILHDKTIDRSQVMIGYEDRFTGIHEIKFNEFKKIHEDEYGIPMHRIRYYKINGSVVWDRARKFDILTRSERPSEHIFDAESKFNLVEGLYRYDATTSQWTLCPHTTLASDDLHISSLADDTFLPAKCQFLTWNILFDYYKSEFICTNQRYEEILKTLKSFLPDFICLQEVTLKFLEILLDELWLKENNYYIIIMDNILNRNRTHAYGQLMLMKNFRPRAFSICPLDIFDDVTTNTRKTSTKQYIIARFGLTAQVTIDIVNLHLHSNHSFNASERRCRALEYLFRTMKTKNYMLMGDFNFGDDDNQEQDILRKYQYEVHDLWKDIYDLDENAGFTFDPFRNTCARITSDLQISLRLDRYLLHALHNVSYSIEHLNMVGLETLPIGTSHNKHINQSDHYALQLIINFRVRSVSHHSALVLLPPMNTWPLIQSYREKYDPLFHQWPPHIKLISPFFDVIDTVDDEENILLPIRLLLTQHKSFDIEINDFDIIKDQHQISMKLTQQSTKYVKQLREHIKQIFPDSFRDDETYYNPHLTIGQFDSTKKQNQVKSFLSLPELIQFPVQHVYVLQQTSNNDETFFHNICQIPIGSILERISFNRISNIDSNLQEFFQRINLYENEKQSCKQKEEKFHRLSACFNELFNKNTLHHFTYAFFPYGSFLLGLCGEDLDTVLILSEQQTYNDKTDLDKELFQLRYDPLGLNDRIMSLITRNMNNNSNNDIIECRSIQAAYPIVSILFQDQTRVEVFVQMKEKLSFVKQHQCQATLIANFHEPIHGVHDIERLIPHVRCPPMFQCLLLFIRTWAKHVGLYGQVYGYLGGYSWAILCAHICHTSLPLEKFSYSTEDFYRLVDKFFSTYSKFDWSSQSICLYSKIYYCNRSSEEDHGSMRILCPSPPYRNVARSTTNSTRYLIIEGFRCVHRLIEQTQKNYEDTLKEIINLSNHFPDKTIQSIIQLKLSGATLTELNHWIGYMKSRLANFLNACENECKLFVQTQSHVEIRNEDLVRFYSIGFQLNEQILCRHRQFHYCLNKFLDQFLICSFRTDTMKISYKLMSVYDWHKERDNI